MNKKTYKQSGVDRLAAGQAISKIADTLKNTRSPQVISGANDFGALYHLTGYDDPVLVSSTDGVGTKLKLAIAMERYDTIGEDLVNACINDVIVSGAQPLFFLDYIAVGRLNPDIISDIVAKYKARMDKLEPTLKQIVKEELDDKELKEMEAKVNKMKNKVQGKSKDQRDWFQSRKERRDEQSKLNSCLYKDRE